MFFARPLLAASLMGLLAAAGLAGTDASAQQIYRIVGPDGRVTFSDQPPREVNARVTTAKAVPLSAGGSDIASLPFELRQAASRFPVTFYSAPGCGPCDAGRTLLAGRGIPFAEKTVTTNEDIDALKRIAGGASVPFLTIGGQQIKGFSEIEWGQFLDAAGYPRTSQLPAGFSQAPAAPLIAAQEPKPAVRPPTPAQPSAAAPLPAELPGDNPSGIRF